MSDSFPLAVAEVLEHEAFVRGLARATLGADDQADDVVQETLAAGVRRRGGPLRSVRAWLATVARRRSVDTLRRDATRRRHEESASRAATRTSPAPDEILAREEARRALVEELVALDLPSREVLVLRYYDDLAPREIAARLGVPVETVRTRTKRALARLRERLDARHGGDRRRWAAPLAGAVGLASAATVVSSSAGLVPWLLGGAAAAVLGVGAFHFFAEGDSAPAVPIVVADVAAADRPTLAGSGRALAAAPLERGSSRILGWVTSNGHPVAATVELRRAPGIGAAEMRLHPWSDEAFRDSTSAPMTHVATDSRGAFVFDGLPPGLYGVRARLASGGYASRLVRLLWEGVRGSGSIDVADGPYALVGRVIAPDGTPSAALVRVSFGDQEFPLRGERAAVSTDAEGRFAVDHLPEGEVGVDVHPLESGMTYASESVYVPAEGPLTIALRPPLADARAPLRGRVEGTVTDPEGRPVGDVLVQAQGRADANFRDFSFGPRVITDAAGRFVVEGLGAGWVRLVVHDRGWTTPGLGDAREGADPLIHATNAEGRATVALRVTRSAVLRGAVRDDVGAPVAGAEVVLEPERGRNGVTSADARTVSAADGSFEIDAVLPDAECVVEARSPELAWPAATRLRTPADGDGRVELSGVRLDPTRWVDIEVRDETTNDLVDGVRVNLSLRDGPDESQASFPNAQSVGKDGHLLLGPLPAGDLLLSVDGSDVQARARIPVTFPRTLVLVKREGSIQGRVLVPRGHNAFFVTLALESLDPGVQVPEGFEDWDDVRDDGRFVLSPLPPGRWKLVARDTMWEAPLAAETVVETGARDVRLRLEPTLPAAPDEAPERWIEWRIRVLGPTGAPVPSASVGVWSLSENGQGRTGLQVKAPDGEVYRRRGGPTHSWFEVTDVKDALGRPLPLGAALVGPHDLSATGGAIDLRVGPEKRIRGVVRDNTGAAVRGAEVSAMARWPGPLEVNPGARSLHARALTDADGRFDLGGLGDVDYELAIVLPRGFAMAAAVPVVRGGGAEVVVPVVRTVSPVVRVVDERGEPVADVPVRAIPVGRTREWPEMDDDLPGIAHEPTDALGRATLRGLAPDRPYVLEVGIEGQLHVVQPQRIEPWTPADTTARVRRVVFLLVRVLGTDGVPIPRAEVRVEGGQQSREADAEGRLRLPVLHGETYRLVARHGRMPAGDPVDVTAAAGDVVLRAPRGLDFEVRIADWTQRWADTDFQIVDGAGKRLLGGGGSHVDGKGVLRWEGYPPGSRLAVRIKTQRNALVATAKDVLVGEPATVHLEPGAELRGRLIGPGGTVPPNPRLGATGEEGLDLDLELQLDGSFVIRGLKRGERVRVRGSGGPLDAQRQPTWSTNLLHVEDGRPLDLEVRPP